MHGMSSVIDKLFRMPNDQAYSTSGMLFGAKLMNLAGNIGVQDAELKGIWGQYLQNCIRPDITINKKYTWSAFANSGNIFTFLHNNNPSPLRRISMENDFITCQDALPRIEVMFNDEVGKSWSLIGTQSQGAKWAKDEALLQNSLQNSMREFANISQSASEIMKQNIAINAVREGLYSNAASVDAVGASLNYAQAQNQSNITSTMISMGLNAKSWLPIVHSVLIILIVCTSIPVFLVCFVPGMTLNILKGYMNGYFYLATWPMFFTFINMIMTYSLMGGTADTMLANNGVISLSSRDQVQQLQNQYSAVAGWLMMAVPFIAAKALSGGTAMASSLMHQFSSTANSSATKNSGALSSGDLGFGNLQVDNQTLSNMNANKHDTMSLDNQFGAKTYRADGTAVTQFANGNVYDASGAMSRTAFDVNSGTVQTSALQRGLQALGTGGRVGGKLSAGGKRSHNWSDSEDNTTSTTDRNSQSHQEQFNEAMGKVKQYSSNENTSSLNSETQQAAINFNDSYRKSEDLADNLELSHSKSQAYSAALQASQNGTLGMNTDLKQEFQEYVEQYRPNNVEAIMNGSSGEVRDIRDAMFDGFMAEKFQNYDPQLATAHDNSRFNEPVDTITGMDLNGQYQKGSEGLQTLVKDSQSGKLTGMRESYLDESSDLFSKQTLGEKRVDSHDNREQLGGKVVNDIPTVPESTPPPETPKSEEKQTISLKDIELPKTIKPF
jgi:conjugal transfer mating pair stabilization protein TraG